VTREQTLEAALRAILDVMSSGNPTLSPLARADFVRDTCRAAIATKPDPIQRLVYDGRTD
jgi:hypothetical protein